MPASRSRVFSNRVAALAALLLAACQKAAPEKVNPPLWEVSGANGEKAWLLGTIHALPAPVDWRSSAVDQAMEAADRIVLEVADIEDERATARAFAELGACRCDLPLRDRLPAALHPAYDRYIARYGINDEQLAVQDTWAAALILAQYAQRSMKRDSANGIDRAVRRAAGNRPVDQFEGAEGQLRIFDALPEADQRDLLAAVVGGNGDPAAALQRMERAWARGDTSTIERGTHDDLLADPELRQALLVNRNTAWTRRITAMLKNGAKPFVAVGTAHLVGGDGVPTQLEAQGYAVHRVQ